MRLGITAALMTLSAFAPVQISTASEVILQNRTYIKDGWYDYVGYQRISILSKLYQVVISESNPHRRKDDATWSLFKVSYRNRPLLSDTGANSTTARLRPTASGDSGWIGSYHGGTPIHELSLTLGDKTKPLQPFPEITGSTNWRRQTLGKSDHVRFRKVAQLGPYRYDATLVVTPDGVEEQFTFIPEGTGKEVTTLVPYSHNLDRSYRHWIAATEDGEPLSGNFTPDLLADAPAVDLGTARWIAAYAPETKTGILLLYSTPLPAGARQQLRSRPNDHLQQLIIPPNLSTPVALTCRIIGFNAEADDWTDEALRLATPPAP